MFFKSTTLANKMCSFDVEFIIKKSDWSVLLAIDQDTDVILEVIEKRGSKMLAE